MTSSQAINSQKTPDQLVFNLRHMENGTYTVKGQMREKWWQALCQELGFPVAGAGEVDLTLELSLPRFRVYGHLTMTLKRQCVRSLEAFDHQTTTHVDEYLTLRQDTDDGGEIYHENDILDMGEYLRQQFILAVDPHPINGDNKRDGGRDGGRGGVVLSDGLDDNPDEDEENPFAVLKNMGN